MNHFIRGRRQRTNIFCSRTNDINSEKKKKQKNVANEHQAFHSICVNEKYFRVTATASPPATAIATAVTTKIRNGFILQNEIRCLTNEMSQNEEDPSVP